MATTTPSKRTTAASHGTAAAGAKSELSAVGHLSVAERAARGKAARTEVPRADHAKFEPPPGRADPVALLEGQAKTRVPELVPIRYGRMLVSPFTFYRGAALLMANDLASTPRSGLNVQCCGDAHLSNFGVFASPERRLMFDVNDFDETLPGPWEWDVKRLAVSMLVAARDNGFRAKDQERIVLDTVGSYRTAMAAFAGMKNLEVWYSHLDIESAIQEYGSQFKPKMVKRTEKNVAKARTKDSMTAFSKLTEVVDGKAQITDQSPLIVPIEQLAQGRERDEMFEALRQLLRGYRETLEFDRRVLLEEFELADFARKVVGVGSVGTRAYIALLIGRDGQDPLFLQMKEAEASVLEEFLGPERVLKPRRAGGRRPAADAGRQRHLPRLATHRLRARRQASRLLRPPAQGLEGLGGDRADGPSGHGHLREAVRLDARPCARAQRRPDRDRRLPRQRRQLRPRHRRVLQSVRRTKRQRLSESCRGRQIRQDHRQDGPLASHWDQSMLVRWGIRLATSLVGIAVGILASSAVLSKFSIDATAVVEATLIFWLVHLVVQLIALRVLVHEPSIALAGLLALASTIVALLIVNAIVSGLAIHGFQTYVFATLIIWATTSISDMIGRRMIRARRPE